MGFTCGLHIPQKQYTGNMCKLYRFLTIIFFYYRTAPFFNAAPAHRALGAVADHTLRTLFFSNIPSPRRRPPCRAAYSHVPPSAPQLFIPFPLSLFPARRPSTLFTQTCAALFYTHPSSLLSLANLNRRHTFLKRGALHFFFTPSKAPPRPTSYHPIAHQTSQPHHILSCAAISFQSPQTPRNAGLPHHPRNAPPPHPRPNRHVAQLYPPYFSVTPPRPFPHHPAFRFSVSNISPIHISTY